MVEGEEDRVTPTSDVARIEDFEAGQQASFTKTFTDEDLESFIAITGDTNPLHVDDAPNVPDRG